MSRKALLVVLLVSAVASVMAPSRTHASTPELRAAEERYRQVVKEVAEAEQRAKAEEEAALQQAKTLLPKAEDSALKRAVQVVLLNIGRFLTLKQLIENPGLGVFHILSGMLLEELRITPAEIQALEQRKGAVDHTKRELAKLDEVIGLLKEERAKWTQSSSTNVGDACADERHEADAVALIEALRTAASRPGDAPAPLGGYLRVDVPADQYAQVDTDVDFFVTVHGGRPPYSVRVKSRAFSDIETRLGQSGEKFDRPLRFTQEGVYRVDVVVTDDSGRQSEGKSVVYNVRTDPVPKPPAGDGSTTALELVLPSDQEVKLNPSGETAIDVPIVVRGGTPPYQIAVTAPPQATTRGKVDASGDTYRPTLRFPREGDYRVDVTVTDDGKAPDRATGRVVPSAQTKSGTIVYKVRQDPAPPPSTTARNRLEVFDVSPAPGQYWPEDRPAQVAPQEDIVLSFRIADGVPPYRVRISSLAFDDIEATVEARPEPSLRIARSGTRFERRVRFPQEATVTVIITVTDSAPAAARARASETVEYRVRDPQPLNALRVDPRTATVETGESRQLKAIGTFGDRTGGHEKDVSRDVTWTGAEKDGTFKAANPGTYTVWAKLKDQQAQATITVTAGSTTTTPTPPGGANLVRIEVDPSSTTVEVGETRKFRATGTYSDRPDNTEDVTDVVTWEGVDADRNFRAERAGTYTVTAVHKNLRARANVTVTAPMTTRPELTVELDCGESFELAPGHDRMCGIIVRGWRSNTTERVTVEIDYPGTSGLEVTPRNTSQDPGNMYTAGVSDKQGQYVFGETFRALPSAQPGQVPILITVRQAGARTAMLNVTASILPRGQLPGSGPGIRPPATVATGTGGEYCVWRYKMVGDKPNCFHFVAAGCGEPRYTNPANGYEMVGTSMKKSEADARIGELSRYHDDSYGCQVAKTPPPLPPGGLGGSLTAELDCGDAFEIAPGDMGRMCNVVVRGWQSSTSNRVSVDIDYPPGGLEVFPRRQDQDPGNMFASGVSDKQGQYSFGETFRARPNAPPGDVPVTITVSQAGAGATRVSTTVTILPKGVQPGTGAGSRPPATVTTGTKGGEFCVWRYKLFGDPPACFHFVAATCATPRYNNPANGYELVGASLLWSEADARVQDLSRYFDDTYACRAQSTTATTTTPKQPGTSTPAPGDAPPQKPTDTTQPPKDPAAPAGPFLSRFGVRCSPDTFTDGGSTQCQAFAVYSNKPDETVEVTSRASWSLGPTFTPLGDGKFAITATLDGASASTTVTVNPYNPSTDKNKSTPGKNGGGKGVPIPGGDSSTVAQGPSDGKNDGGKSGGGGLGGTDVGPQNQGGTTTGSGGSNTGSGTTTFDGPAPGAVTGGVILPPGTFMCTNPQTGFQQPCCLNPRTGLYQSPPCPSIGGFEGPKTAGVTPPGPKNPPTPPPPPPTPPVVVPPKPPVTPPPPTPPLVVPPKPPVTPPPTPPPVVASGAQCAEPLCREMCIINCNNSTSVLGGSCEGACTRLAADKKTVINACPKSTYKLAEVKAACYDNMLLRCNQGQAGGTGGWCVGPGADKTCPARAAQVCRCGDKPQCRGNWGDSSNQDFDRPSFAADASAWPLLASLSTCEVSHRD